VVFLLAFLVNIWLGKKKNETLALAWARAFCQDGALLDRQFSLLGDSEGAEVRAPGSDALLRRQAGRRTDWWTEEWAWLWGRCNSECVRACLPQTSRSS
jgi:hypothetical protein